LAPFFLSILADFTRLDPEHWSAYWYLMNQQLFARLALALVVILKVDASARDKYYYSIICKQLVHLLFCLGEHKSLQSLPQLGNALCAEKLEANSKVT
jgi:hypothetical protein